MRINDVELFDLYGNGTLVMKTNVDEQTDDLRYTWYVKSNGQNIYKGSYQRNPFTAIQISHLGRYAVRAFVRDGAGNKVELEAEFHANKKTSPVLASAESVVAVTAKAEHVSGAFWKFNAEGDVPKNAQYAWYVFREGSEEPVFKGVYSDEDSFVYSFEEHGTYYAKLFVLFDGRKISATTESVTF